jgi:hypothetical protein
MLLGHVARTLRWAMALGAESVMALGCTHTRVTQSVHSPHFAPVTCLSAFPSARVLVAPSDCTNTAFDETAAGN